jgi:DNA polymerase III subunit chi
LTDVLFYHLQDRRLEDVLPPLLEKCLERNWRVVVEAGSDERVEALDAHLWTYRDDAFLPHGTTADAPGQQPILLLTGSETPNKAHVRFLVDGAAPADLSGLERAVLIFDGNDETAVQSARKHWKSVKEAGHSPTYWQQVDGRWEKKA